MNESGHKGEYFHLKYYSVYIWPVRKIGKYHGEWELIKKGWKRPANGVLYLNQENSRFSHSKARQQMWGGEGQRREAGTETALPACPELKLIYSKFPPNFGRHPHTPPSAKNKQTKTNKQTTTTTKTTLPTERRRYQIKHITLKLLRNDQ